MTARPFTPAQRRQVMRAIRDGHLAFLAEVFGPDAIDRGDYDRLRSAGKIRDDRLTPQDAASAAHAIGAIVGRALPDDDLRAPHVSAARQHAVQALAFPDEFWRRVGADIQTITDAERDAIAVARDRIAEHVRALAARLEEAVGRAMTDADDGSRRRRLTRAPGGGSSPAREVIAAASRAMATLRRDWLRVAHTEIHNAAEEAKAIALAHRDPSRDPRVFKRPRPDACSFCRMLYLKPDGVTPRVFRLSALLANGTNVGRRAGRPSRSGKGRTEWKAVIGAVHPFCQCSLHLLADGMGFDARGQLVRVGVAKSSTIEVESVPRDADHVCEVP